MPKADQIDDRSEYLAPDYTEGKYYDTGKDQKAWLIVHLLVGLVILIIADHLWIKAFSLAFAVIGLLGFLSYREGPGYLIPVDKWESWKIRKQNGFISAEQVNSKDGKVQPPIKYGTTYVYLGNEDQDGTTAQQIGHVLPTGLVRNADCTRLSIYFQFDGSTAPSEDWDERMAFEQRVMDVLAQAAALVGYEESDLSFAQVVSGRPHNPHTWIHGLAARDLHKDFLFPDSGTMEHVLAGLIDGRIRYNAETGRDAMNVYVFTVKAPPAWRRAIMGKGELTASEVAVSDLYALSSHVVEGLRSLDLINARCLNLLELDEFIRLQRTVGRVGHLHKWLYDRRKRFAKMSREEVIAELEGSDPWPTELIRLGDDYLYMDGTYFRLYRTLHFKGSRRFRPGSMLPLQHTNNAMWATTTVTGSVLSTASQEAKMTREIVWTAAFMRSKDDHKKYLSQRERDDRGRVQARQTWLYQQNAPVFRFSRLVLVAAPTREALDRYSRWKVATHSLRMILLRKVTDPSRQLRVLANVLLGQDD